MTTLEFFPHWSLKWEWPYCFRWNIQGVILDNGSVLGKGKYHITQGTHRACTSSLEVCRHIESYDRGRKETCTGGRHWK